LHLRPIALVKRNITESAMRRLIVDAGEDFDALMKLVRADITSKDGNKVKQFLKNYDEVEKKLKELEQKDELRNFQPIITGEIIMETFNLPPSKEVGEIKQEIRDAILDGYVKNEMEDAFAYLLQLGQKRGFSTKLKTM
jgi:poly(A) polymerase